MAQPLCETLSGVQAVSETSAPASERVTGPGEKTGKRGVIWGVHAFLSAFEGVAHKEDHEESRALRTSSWTVSKQDRAFRNCFTHF